MAQGVSVWVLEAPDGFGDADYHAHHAIQITVALSGALSLTSGGVTLAGPSLAVAADALHRFEAHGLLAFVFVEPESRFGRALGQKLFAGAPLVAVEDPAVAAILEPLHATFDAQLDRETLLRAGREVVEALAPGTEPRLPDPRVQRIIDYATRHLDQPLSLEKAAEGVFRSPSRLRHLFVEQTGLAFKTYLLWLRLVKAVQTYSEGSATLTEAAHLAGFSDSAHFSRVFKRTFGLPATTLTRF
jgi:AraC-like DNA-binding protein